MNEANITLSRQTLERLQDNFWTLTPNEAIAVNEALKAMHENDKLETIKKVPNPKGTISHSEKRNNLAF